MPATEQTARVVAFDFEAETVNRSMDITIGNSQASKTYANSVARANAAGYVTRFISDPINQTGIAANTWRLNFAIKHSNLSTVDDYPTRDTTTAIPVTCYVWRPSSGTKVGNIFDANSTVGYYDAGSFNGPGTTSEVAEDGTFAGSAVAGATTGDVVVVEAFVNVYTKSTNIVTLSFFYDGGTETLVNATVVSDHASFLETPENLVFETAPSANAYPLYKSFSNTGFIPQVSSRTF